eukprot:TRINITY_DN20884_c0_g1_i1.p1 TRINITY_DN20884_c0_g1~~TRINITY_DN20884_c0_g1_i1.p1  ORF type:complete len:817 (+),score=-131.44 TRINITY_DN20884_c0_g1_i1:570-3020(+)
MIEIEIDGQRVEVPEGASIIEAADQAGIPIPRFCYHKKLSVAANCRMCLVEVEKAPKPLPACATPVTKGMKVSTHSEKTRAAQQSVMEFLLINHPLDCPICDQGGECALQDFSLEYGHADSVYQEEKRAVPPIALGELIATEMTRCIHCTRCVRFAQEVAGLPELGLIDRGEAVKVQNAIEGVMDSELSGNIIDLCPVGALTAKPSLYSQRSWEAFEYPTIAPHDCLGSHIYVHVKEKAVESPASVYRVVPRVCEAINENWISDKDRFGYQGITHKSRATTPLVKDKQGQWVESTWRAALLKVAGELLSSVAAQRAEDIGILLNNNATVEEGRLLREYAEALGLANIDSRLRMQALELDLFTDRYPYGRLTLAEINQKKCIVLIGVDIEKEYPLLAHRLRQAVKQGCKIFCINPINYATQFPVAGRLCTLDFRGVLDALWGKVSAQAVGAHDKDKIDCLTELAEVLGDVREGSLLLCGASFLNHKEYGVLKRKIAQISAYFSTQWAVLTEGPNALGLYWAGVLPGLSASAMSASRAGLDARAMCVEKPRKKYVLFGLEAEQDTAYPGALLSALQAAEFTVCFTSFVSEKMYEYADVILPIATFSETEGSFVNIEGKYQNFQAVAPLPGKAQAGWKALRALARVTAQTELGEQCLSSVQQESLAKLSQLKTLAEYGKSLMSEAGACPPAHSLCVEQVLRDQKSGEGITTGSLIRLAPYRQYSENALLRRCESLHKREKGRDPMGAVVHPSVAQSIGVSSGMSVKLTQGTSSLILPLITNSAVAEGVVLLPMGLQGSMGFGESMATITIEKISEALTP